MQPLTRGGREAQAPTRSSPRAGRQPTGLARVSTGLCGQATNQRNRQPSTSARQRGTGCRVPEASSANGAPRAGPGVWAVTRGELAARSSPGSRGPAPQSQHISFQMPPPEEGPPRRLSTVLSAPARQAGPHARQPSVPGHRIISSRCCRNNAQRAKPGGSQAPRSPWHWPGGASPAPGSRAPCALARS